MAKKLEIRVPKPSHKVPGDIVKVKINETQMVFVTIPEYDSEAWNTTPEEQQRGKQFFRTTVTEDQIETRAPRSPPASTTTPSSPSIQSAQAEPVENKFATSISPKASEPTATEEAESNVEQLGSSQDNAKEWSNDPDQHMAENTALEDHDEEAVAPRLETVSPVSTKQARFFGSTAATATQVEEAQSSNNDSAESTDGATNSKSRWHFPKFGKRDAKHKSASEQEDTTANTQPASSGTNSQTNRETHTTPSGVPQQRKGVVQSERNNVRFALSENPDPDRAARARDAVDTLESESEKFDKHRDTLVEVMFSLKIVVITTTLSLLTLNWWGFLAGILPTISTYVLMSQIKDALAKRSLMDLDARVVVDLCIASCFFSFLIAFFGFFTPAAAFVFTLPVVGRGSQQFIAMWSAAGGTVALFMLGFSIFLLRAMQSISRDTPFKWTLCAPFARAQTRLDAERENAELWNELQTLKGALGLVQAHSQENQELSQV